MNKRIIALLVTLAVVPFGFVACGEKKEKAFMSGVVYEESTKTPLSGATVYLNDARLDTGADAQFTFSELEPGATYKLKVTKEYFEPFEEDIVAVYPTTTKEVNLKLKKVAEGFASPIKEVSIAKLKSYDFDIAFGSDSKDVAFTMTGSFVAPSSYSFEMKSKERSNTPEINNGKPEEPQERVKKAVQIGNKQWIDDGSGYMLSNEWFPGFNDIFSIVNLDASRLTKSFSAPQAFVDNGLVQIGDKQCRQLRGVSIIEEQLDSKSNKTQKLFVEFNVAIIESGELAGVPVQAELITYQSAREVKTWSKTTLSNFNIPSEIKPPIK